MIVENFNKILDFVFIFVYNEFCLMIMKGICYDFYKRF